MIRERWLLAIAVSMSLSGCTCIENAAFGLPERLESLSEPLPKLFAPLRWDTSEAQLPQLFRGFRVDAGPWFGEPFWRWYRSQHVDAEIGPLGRASVEIQFARPGHGDAPAVITVVTARRNDPRAECAATPTPSQCGRAAPPALSEAFAETRRVVESRYGPGAASPDLGPGAQEVAWSRDGFTLSLSLRRRIPAGDALQSEADGRWLLELAAETDRAF